MKNEPDRTIQELVSDKKKFSNFVYTSWNDAIEELKIRQSDGALNTYIREALPNGAPDILTGKKSIVLFRHIATPNYEINRFIACADAYPDFQPLIFEYTEDQFNDRNLAKYYLGKLRLHKGANKLNESIHEKIGIINFNESNTKPIHTIRTHWGQLLIDFHHELFQSRFKDFANSAYDLSNWLHSYGMTAKEYYKPFLTLFLRDAILFENFLIDTKESSFIESVILPSFCQIFKESGVKPLIVTLAPTELETEDFWYSYPYDTKKMIDLKIKSSGG